MCKVVVLLNKPFSFLTSFFRCRRCLSSLLHTLYKVLEMSEKMVTNIIIIQNGLLKYFLCDVLCILLCGETKAVVLAVLVVGCTHYYVHLLSRIMVPKEHQTIV